MTSPRDLGLPPHLARRAQAALDAVGAPPRMARAGARPRQATKRVQAPTVPFPAVCAAYGLPEPVAEFRFAPPRKWQLDWAWPDHRVALEVEGWGHRTKAKFDRDLSKYNRLAALGWRLVRCTPKTRDTDATLAAVQAAITHEES